MFWLKQDATSFKIKGFLKKILGFIHPNIHWCVYRGCSIHAVELLTTKIKQILEKKDNKAVVNSILGNINIKHKTLKCI